MGEGSRWGWEGGEGGPVNVFQPWSPSMLFRSLNSSGPFGSGNKGDRLLTLLHKGEKRRALV